MTTPIPTTPSITESALIPAPLASVWHLIKLPLFPLFWTSLSSAHPLPASEGTSPEVDVIRWEFADGTCQQVKQEEHSALEHYISYSVISSEPALSYSGVVSTVRCWAVTSGEHEGGTFVTWTGSFSGDADAGELLRAPSFILGEEEEGVEERRGECGLYVNMGQ